MTWALVVPVTQAKPLIDALKKANLLDSGHASALLEGGLVALPCRAAAADEGTLPPAVQAAVDSQLARLQDVRLSASGRAQAASPHATLRETVGRLLSLSGAPLSLLDDLPKRWERLGDVALLPSSCLRAEGWSSVPQPELWAALASALGVRRLARQASVDAGPLRHSHASLLHPPGCADGWTETRENGVLYALDCLCSMYSSGNGTEKARVASLPAAGETVVDLFAGIGYWTLPLLVHAKARHVFACDLNPVSLEGLRRGLALNGLPESACTVLEGDCSRIAPRRVAHRVMLGLLPSAEVGYAAAVDALREQGGMLHVHGNAPQGGQAQWGSDVAAALAARAGTQRGPSWRARLVHVEVVKSYAPRVLHCVADVWLAPVAPPAPHAASLVQLANPSAETLQERAVSLGLPAHIGGLQLGGSCWGPASLAESADGGRAVAVHLCNEASLNWHPKNFSLRTMPLRELAALVEDAAAPPSWLYLRSVGDDARKQPACFFTDYPALASQMQLPPCALPAGRGRAGLHSSVLRLASPGLRLWLHYDALDNVLLQLHGEKRVLLFPPSAAGGLYLAGSSSRIPTALLDDPSAAAAAGFPRYAAARAAALELRLVAGEALHIPANWAHFVACDEGQASTALNLFWLPEGDAAEQHDVYGNADPPAALSALQAADAAERALLALPPSARAFFLARIVAQLEDAAY